MNRQISSLLFWSVILLFVACRSAVQTGSSPISLPTVTPTPSPTHTPTPSPLSVDVPRGTVLDRFRPQDPFTLVFGQPMDPSGVTSSLLFFSPVLAGRAGWDDTQTTLTFVPDPGFAPGQTYSVTLNTALKSADGRAFDHTPAWRIQVLSAPQVVSAPRNEWSLTERRPSFSITFDRKMNQDSVAAALQVTPTVPLILVWHQTPQTDTVTITPAGPLNPDTDYQFSLGHTAADADGVLLAQPLSWHARTIALLSRIERAGPMSNAPIHLRFNYPMNPDSVQRAVIFTPPITGTWGWNEAKMVAILTPTHRLSTSTTYTLSFASDLYDANGDSFSELPVRQFTTPPPILSALPKGEGVDPVTAVKITFDRPMDRGKTEAALEITPAVAGQIEWRETTLLFYPQEGYLGENTSYTVTVHPSAVGEDGEPILSEAYSWSFRTGVLQEVADFGWGANAQVLDAEGRRAVQVQVFKPYPSVLNLELYRLDLAQFLDRYASGFRGVVGWEKRPIDIHGATLVKQWQTVLPDTSPAGRIHEILIPDDVPPGLYILNLVAGHLNDQLILVLTRNTLVVKQAEGQLVTWVTDINGGPVPGVEVGVYARDGTLISSGTADDRGIYRAQVARNPQPLIVVARQGDDMTVGGLSNEWRSNANGWWGWWETAPATNRYAVYIYTDRPIYRPGQTVFFKAIIRKDDDALLSLIPEGTPVTVRIRDARDNVVQTFNLSTNALGTVNGRFELAEGAMLGRYAVEVILDNARPQNESHRQAFKVEDYRKPDYQVSVSTNARNYVVGDVVTVTVDSRYFFGEPVANADLTLNLYEGAYGYGWNEYGTDYWYWNGTPYLRTRTDASGMFTMTLQAKMDNVNDYDEWYTRNLKRSTYAIEATVDDGSHQTVSGLAVWHVYNVAEKINLDIGSYLQEPNRPFNVRAQVVTIDGQPVAGRKLIVELRRYERNFGDYTRVLQSAEMITGDDGKGQVALTVQEPGHYRLDVSGQDRSGHSVYASHWIWAFSGAEYAHWYGRSGDLNVYADRDRYAPGETARLLIESSFSGPALLTWERGTTRREQLVELVAPMTVVDLPIMPDDAPNIHVTVNAWKAQDTTLRPDTWTNLPDSELRMATVNLAVPATDKTLNVTIVPDKQNYAPRQQASFTIRVTDAQGRPVQAEVSLAMVDEAIFALSKELVGPIFDAFYGPRDNIVRTFDAMSPRRYLWGEGGGGIGGGGEGSMSVVPRSDFPDTAQWLPTLQTDASGEVVVTVRLPDSLTSWRLTARAVTADTQVGEARINIVTQQPIIVRPILPRALTAGDVVNLSALVHNYDHVARQVTVTLETTSSVRIQSPITQTVTIFPGELGVVGWWVRVSEAGEMPVVVRAQTDDGRFGDAVALSLPVYPLAVPDVTTRIGEMTAGLTTTIQIPQGALGISTVHIELSRSIAGSMLQGLEYLTGFPYGCVEQTMSRALPNAVVGRALRKLGFSSPALADLPSYINASVQRLYGYQHSDGGWGWWYDDATDAYQTAWVVFGLSVTAEAGYEIDNTVIERGVKWLEGQLTGLDPRTRAFALYSMAVAGRGNLEATRRAAQKTDDLDTFSQAALALALHKLGDRAGAQALVDELIEEAIITNGLVSWSGDEYDGHYHQKFMSSPIRSTALALSALIQIRPGHPLEGGVVRWLMNQRKLDGWGSTNETSFTLLALTDHLLAASEATVGTEYSIELNGKLIATGTLGPGEPTVSLDIPVGQMNPGNNTLRIRQSGTGRLYYVIGTRIYMAQEEIAPAGVIKVFREYLDPKTGQPIAYVELGQLVKVRLTFQMPTSGAYILVEDRLPGGLEALNERLNTTGYVGSVYEGSPYRWQEYGYNNKEVRADRVCFFYTELNGGTHTVTYLARAVYAGRFVALPTEVSAMYDMTLWGRSASSRFTVGRSQAALPR